MIKILGRMLVALSAAVFLVGSPVTAANALPVPGSVPFVPNGNTEAVWSALSREGEDGTTVALVNADGTVDSTLGVYSENINGLGFYESAGILVAVIDDQFVDEVDPV